MKDLGANTIRVYHVDPSGDHSACMKAFSDAGIYLFVDLDTFSTQINQDEPLWNGTQFEKFKEVLDEFQQFENTAGVFVGNEILTMPNGSDAAPYIKSAARDIKAYRDSKGYHNIPVGYSAADIAQLRPMLQDYLACGNQSENIDFFSLNSYEWCGTDSSYTISGYSQLQANAADYPLPIFFSETGCIKPPPRTFEDQASIFGPEMAGTWSGAIIYEWLEEANTYGLISYGPTAAATATDAVGGFTRTGTPTPKSPDFTNLKNQWATLSPTGVKLSDYSASVAALSTPACPSSTPDGWLVNGNVDLPTLGQTINRDTTSSSVNTATSTPTGTKAAAATGTSSSTSPTATKGSASGGQRLAGMTVSLLIVMLGFIIWL